MVGYDEIDFQDTNKQNTSNVKSYDNKIRVWKQDKIGKFALSFTTLGTNELSAGPIVVTKDGPDETFTDQEVSIWITLLKSIQVINLDK